MMRTLKLIAIFAILTLCPIIAGAEEALKAVEVAGFTHDQQSIGEGEWTISKYKGFDGNWRARLEAKGAVIKEFGNCGDDQGMMRFLVWPQEHKDLPAGKPLLLFVLRYAGGEHGSEFLDIVDLRRGYRILLETDDQFNFNRVEDLNGDGWPEVVGMARGFVGALKVSIENSPYPTVVLAYQPLMNRYVCSNKTFNQPGDEAAARYQSAFEQAKPVETKVAYAPDDLRAHEMEFAPLLRWVLELHYLGESTEANAALDESATPETCAIVRQSVKEILAKDRYYQEMTAPPKVRPTIKGKKAVVPEAAE